MSFRLSRADAQFKTFEHSIHGSGLRQEFKNAPSVAMINGPAVVIEAIVRKACNDSGIDMDWGYIGGRGIVYSHGDRLKARSALFFAIPTSDLGLGDV